VQFARLRKVLQRSGCVGELFAIVERSLRISMKIHIETHFQSSVAVNMLTWHQGGMRRRTWIDRARERPDVSVHAD
jgi:hypothetical protein